MRREVGAHSLQMPRANQYGNPEDHLCHTFLPHQEFLFIYKRKHL